MSNEVLKQRQPGIFFEMTQEQADADKGDRIYDGVAVFVPESWKRKKKFKLAMSFVDEFEDSDRFHFIGTQLFQTFKNERNFQ
jgi:hypothetical protein